MPPTLAIGGHGISTTRLKPAPTWRVYVAVCLLLGLGVAAYSNAITNRFIGIDTLQNVRDNPDIRALVPLSRALSLHRGGSPDDDSTLIRRPVLSLSFALSHALFGPEAWGFQVGNVAIHIAGALLLFGIVRRMLALRGDADDRHACWLGFSAAAVWLVHPLNTEGVTNIVQRAESMMGCFALLTLYCAIRSWQATAGTAVDRGGALGWSAGAVVACALGMGTKEVMVVVPVLVWLCDAVCVCRSFLVPLRRRPRFYLALATTWAIPVVLVALTIENTAPDFESARFAPYVLSQPRVVMHYLRLAFWPHPLFCYILGRPFWFQPGIDPWFELLLYAAPLAILVGGTLVAVLRLSPFGFLGAAFFLPLLPTSLLTTFTVIQEHRAYLPLAAFATGAVLVADALIARLAPASRRAAVRALVLVLVLTLAALVYGTRLRNQDYRSDLTLWAPDDLPVAFSMLSGLAVHKSRLPEASEVLETMLAAATSASADEPLYAYRVRAASALGTVRVLQARLDEAQKLFAQALAQDPAYAPAENNLGVALVLSGDRPAARQHLQAALRLDPSQAAAHYNYGLVSVMDGNRDEAAEHLARADELLPLSARLGEEQRRALVQANLAASRFSAVLGPPDAEFSMDYTLALIPGSAAR